jgi:hypothetical protein
MEEILDAITVEFNSDEDNSSKGSDEELLSLSVAAVDGGQGNKSIRLHGLINKKAPHLVDSGSSFTFISANVVQRLLGFQTTSTPSIQVTVENGDKMASKAQVPKFSW